MKCKVCGGTTRKIRGIHYIDGKWLMCDAQFCHKHGSYVSLKDLADAIEVEPDPTSREQIRPGLHVLIFTNENRLLQLPVEGYVSCVLTNEMSHGKGIRVRLKDGRKGRVQKILP
jgi:hypothetical protein